MLLDYSMFDNGAFECYNFLLADEDGAYQVDASHKLIQDLKSQIEARMALGQSYLDVSRMDIVHRGFKILEIQWG